MVHRRLVCVTGLLVLVVAHSAAPQAAPAPPHLGSIAFPTSAPPAAQAEFVRGVLYLHSFEYASAEKAFRRAEELEPGFAMAYWGEAMTYNHPVWNEQDYRSGRTALDRLGATPEARRAKAPSAREQRYLEAVEALYGEGSSKPRRDTLYAQVMERVLRENPTDLEAKAFYALALLGLNQGVRDTVTYVRAAVYADSVFRVSPDHPGAAHYLIHAFDDPIHATRGLEAARAYAKIAPDAAHAQHMTTHIFLALGMWDDVVAQNRIAVHLTAEMPGHYTTWLVYALIQQGRYAAARELIEHLRQNLTSGGLRQQYSALAEMRAHYLLHSEDWQSPLLAWRTPPDRMTISGQLIETFTQGVIAFRRRDPTALSAAAGEVGRLVEALGVDHGPTDPVTLAGRVMARQLVGMQLFLGGARDAAVRAFREAAAIEDGMPMEFGPPMIVEPSHEVLGALLLEVQPSDALEQFRRAQALAPGRARGLMGTARSALAVGDKAAAERALDQLSANWHAADSRVRDDLVSLRRLVTRMP